MGLSYDVLFGRKAGGQLTLDSLFGKRPVPAPPRVAPEPEPTPTPEPESRRKTPLEPEPLFDEPEEIPEPPVYVPPAPLDVAPQPVSLPAVVEGAFPPPLRLIRARFSPRAESGYLASQEPLQAVWERLRPGMLAHQRVAVETAYRALEESGGFLLADGTGCGKTSSILGVAELYRCRPDAKRVLIVAPSEAIGKPWATSARHPVLAGSYPNDAKRMKVPLRLVTEPSEMAGNAIFITSYDKMSDKDFVSVVDDSVVVVFDEAHYLKNVAGKESGKGSGRGDIGVQIASRAYATLAATATPGDQVHHMAHLYRTGMLEGKSVVKALDELGITYRPARPLVVGFMLWPKGTDMAVLHKRGLRGDDTDPGVFVTMEAALAFAKDGPPQVVLEVVIEKLPRGVAWCKPDGRGRTWPARGTVKVPSTMIGRSAPLTAHFDPTKDFGKKADKKKHRLGEKRIKPAHIAAKVPVPELQKRMVALFNRMTASGQMLKREIDMTGLTVDFDFSPVPDATVEGRTWPEVEQKILREFWLAWYGDLPDYELDINSFGRLQKAQVQGHIRRALETFKVPRVLAAVEAAVRSGRQTVVFAERVHRSDAIARFSDETGVMIESIVHTSEGTLKILRAELARRGIRYAELHGESDDDNASEAMRRFQSGEVDVCLATAQSGGTGINLDDIVGDRPREMVVMTAPYGATENVQMLGRIHRLTTRSASHATYIFYDTEIDKKSAALMVGKLRFLGAIVKGGVADMALSPALLRSMGMTDEEVAATLEDARDETVLVKSDSVGSTAPLRLEPIAGDKWRVAGNSYTYRERIKKTGVARWVPERKQWEVSATGVGRFRQALGQLLDDRSADTSGMPGARTFDAFVLGIVSGEIEPCRSPRDNEKLRTSVKGAPADSPVRETIRALHEAHVRRAVLAGWPVPDAVRSLYPAAVAGAEAVRQSRAAEVTDLLDSGMGSYSQPAEQVPTAGQARLALGR